MSIKERMSKARSLISVNTYKRPIIFVIGMMLLINIIILFIAAFIAVLISDDYTNVIDAFANGSLKWMLTPNAILQVQDANVLLLAVIVLIVGMVLFTGTIIALTTNQIKDYFQKKKSGSGKIFLEKHIAILNWNNKVPELVADLINIEEANLTVVILADVEKDYAERQIVNTVSKLYKNQKKITNLNILVKTGDPLLQSDLYDISIEEAIAVIIMNKDLYENISYDMTKSDLNVIKTILNVGRVAFKYIPPIVAEVKRIETKEKIQTMGRVVETLQKHMLLPICFDRRLGQIIAQTIIHNYMEDVYLSMFSFEGSEVYRLRNVAFDDCLNNYTDCIPLARKSGDLFVLSENFKTIYNKDDTKINKIDLVTKKYKEATDLEVYIIGSNNKLGFIMNAFNEYEKIYHNKFKALWIEEKNIESFVEEINQGSEPVTIVLLSDENQEKDSMDANVINNLIYLEGKIQRDNVNIIVELLDPSNDKIIKDFNIKNTIISNKIISLLLTKLALYKETESFYENLLTLRINEEEEDAQEAFIRKASNMLDETFPISFSNKKECIISIYEAFNHTLIPFGIIKNGSLEILSTDLHKKEEFTIDSEDLLVMMKLQK